MTLRSLSFGLVAVLAMAFLSLGNTAKAELLGGPTVNVGVDASENWIGFMSVSDLTSGGDVGQTSVQGGFQFETGWGFNDLAANFVGSELVFGPRLSPEAYTDAFWFQNDMSGPVLGATGNVLGNKFMEASGFVEANMGVYQNNNLVFSGNINDYGLSSAHTFEVFIKDFEGGFSNVVETSQFINSDGSFSINQFIRGTNDVVQYGFRMSGVNIDPNNAAGVAGFGNVSIGVVPEPGTMVTFGLGLFGLAARRRRS